MVRSLWAIMHGGCRGGRTPVRPYEMACSESKPMWGMMLNANLFDLFRARDRFSARVNESNITRGVDWSALYRDRYTYARESVQAEALRAWRLNPLARRITNLVKHYVTAGVQFHAQDPALAEFLRAFWEHPLNRIGQHLGEWVDELQLTGNLFLAITTDRAGMSYVRAFPTDQIAEIITAPNDVQQEIAYQPKPSVDAPDPAAIPAYWARGKRGARVVMLHYAVNRLAGMKWGEPDIAPLLPWLARYAAWMEDRVRLNRFRQAYLYQVKGNYLTKADRERRQRELAANPPQPGSILVTDGSEEWSVISPKLDAFEAGSDGMALKKLIAGGQGFPMHWLAEPESATRTTAEAAGTPTFKSLEERQKFFRMLLKEVLEIAAARRRQKGGGSPEGEVSVTAADISERDNAALALAGTQVVSAFAQLRSAGLIGDEEYLRIVYRFIGEELPGHRPDAPEANIAPKARPAGMHVSAESGDVTTNAEF